MTILSFAPQQQAPTVRGDDFHAPAHRSRRGDPIGGLLQNVMGGEYETLEDVATGRCLKNSNEAEILELLESIDPTNLTKVREGRGWMIAEAPFEVWDERSHRWRQALLTLRFTFVDERWKIEHLGVRQLQKMRRG